MSRALRALSNSSETSNFKNHLTVTISTSHYQQTNSIKSKTVTKKDTKTFSTTVYKTHKDFYFSIKTSDSRPIKAT